MSTMTIQLPESLKKSIEALAARLGNYETLDEQLRRLSAHSPDEGR